MQTGLGVIKNRAKAHDMLEEHVIREVMLASQPNKRFVELEQLGALPIEGGWTAR